MRILRDNKDSLMSVLEAFVHDPLVEWENDKARIVSAVPFSSIFPSPSDFTDRAFALSSLLLGSKPEECQAEEPQPQEQASSRSRRRNRTDNHRSPRIEGPRSYREETTRSPSSLRHSWRSRPYQGDQRWEPGRGRHSGSYFEAQLGEGESRLFLCFPSLAC